MTTVMIIIFSAAILMASLIHFAEKYNDRIARKEKSDE